MTAGGQRTGHPPGAGQPAGDGRNPALVTGDIRPPVRITLLRHQVPDTPGARCQGQGDLFFSAEPGDITAARLICSGCPARTSCYLGAAERGELSGVWGGTDFDPNHQREDQAS